MTPYSPYREALHHLLRQTEQKGWMESADILQAVLPWATPAQRSAIINMASHSDFFVSAPPLYIKGCVHVLHVFPSPTSASDNKPFIKYAYAGRAAQSYTCDWQEDLKTYACLQNQHYYLEASEFAERNWGDYTNWDMSRATLCGALVNREGPVTYAYAALLQRPVRDSLCWEDCEPPCELIDDSICRRPVTGRKQGGRLLSALVSVDPLERREIISGRKPFLLLHCSQCGGGILPSGQCIECGLTPTFKLPEVTAPVTVSIPKTVSAAASIANTWQGRNPDTARYHEHLRWVRERLGQLETQDYDSDSYDRPLRVVELDQ